MAAEACKACLIGRGEHNHEIKTCAGCMWHSGKWTFLGTKPFCRLYKRIRNDRCIDWKPKHAP